MKTWPTSRVLPLLSGLLAILVHVAILNIPVLLVDTPLRKDFAEKKDNLVEVIPEEDIRERKPVVHTDHSEEEPQEDTGARFFGEFRNRTSKETRAPKSGSYQKGRVKPEVDPHEGEGASMSDLMQMGSQPHALPGDVPYGEGTILNTDKVLYASFINRIADEIYVPWVKLAEGATDFIYADKRKLETNVYVTRLKVVMNHEGGVTAIQVLQSSGVPELDEAPKKAFWDNEPFPNPPSQLFDEDGFVRLTYEFQFEWRHSQFNILPAIL